MPLEKELLVASVFPMCSQWPSSSLLVCSKYTNLHWIVTGILLGARISQCGSSDILVYLWFQWSSSVFQLCKLTLDCHWKTTGWEHQAVWFQLNLSSGIPVSVLRTSDLEVIRWGHFPECNSLCIQLLWRELFDLSWFHLRCNPKYTKTVMVLISNACTEWCWSTHTFEERN